MPVCLQCKEGEGGAATGQHALKREAQWQHLLSIRVHGFRMAPEILEPRRTPRPRSVHVRLDALRERRAAALLARLQDVRARAAARDCAGPNQVLVQLVGLVELLELDAAVDGVAEGEAIGLDARCPHGVEEVYGLLHPVGGGAGPDQRAVGLAVGDQSVLLHPVEELQGLARQAQDGAGAQRGVERHPVELDPALYHLLVELQRELWPGPLVGEHDAAVGRRGETHAPVSEPHEGP
mmetsp:Transcript_70848/g.197680  ORF Transcript_70848/g.197680 Transcript_70848/m.197680 type:complete len:237 (+) Transcript_70848:871-1581(+)